MKSLLPRLRQDDGMSLVEVLVAIMLLGIGGVALMVGLATVIKSGRSHRGLAEDDVALVLAATAATDEAQVPYIPCATAAQYSSAALRPVGWSASDLSVSAIQYWTGTGFQPSVAACMDNDAAAGPFARLQLLTIRAVNPNGGAVHTINVVKRDS
ncbi:MAG: hypothetical protein JWL70_2529 [Acidimicrobiia bacterium]|nr:hypothetical protein [Acidimicrobiia bacterium]